MTPEFRRNRLTAIDLCSGPGGVTTGYKAAGVKVLAGVDVDTHSRATYETNHPEIDLLPDDLATLAPERLLDLVGLCPKQLDILTACVPCQTFSSLGRRHRRKDDPRNELVGRVGDFTARILPRAVVMENVPFLVKEDRFGALVGQLRDKGYGVWFDVVDAADFGVPQRRKRLVVIAVRGADDDEVPALDSHHPALERFRERRTVRDAFRLLRRRSANDPLSVPRTKYPEIVARRIAAIPRNGGSRTCLPAELELRCHDSIRTSGACSVYGRMTLDDVAPTLTTRCTTPSCGRFVHPWANRAITLREAACLQTFPVDYEFKGGSMAIQSQIGNAVPPRLAEAIAVLVTSTLEQPSSPISDG